MAKELLSDEIKVELDNRFEHHLQLCIMTEGLGGARTIEVALKEAVELTTAEYVRKNKDWGIAEEFTSQEVLEQAVRTYLDAMVALTFAKAVDLLGNSDSEAAAKQYESLLNVVTNHAGNFTTFLAGVRFAGLELAYVEDMSDDELEVAIAALSSKVRTELIVGNKIGRREKAQQEMVIAFVEENPHLQPQAFYDQLVTILQANSSAMIADGLHSNRLLDELLQDGFRAAQDNMLYYDPRHVFLESLGVAEATSQVREDLLKTWGMWQD